MKVGRLMKEQMLEDLSRQLGERPNLFVTQVNRLSASGANTFRQQLHASGARFLVVKRRLGQRALASLKVDGVADLLEGSVGLVLPHAEGEIIAKLIAEFIKANVGQLTIRGAVLDGQVMDRQRVEELASLPPKAILLAQVVLTIESPMADVIFTVERLIGDVAWIIEERAKQRPKEKEQANAAVEAAPTDAQSAEPSSTQAATAQREAKDETATPPTTEEKPPATPPTTEEGTTV